MSSYDDELRKLQASWKAIEPPAQDNELHNEDAATQASVRWMQSAHANTDADQLPEQDAATQAAVQWMQAAFASQVAPAPRRTSPRPIRQSTRKTTLRLVSRAFAGMAAASLIAYFFGFGSRTTPDTNITQPPTEVAVGPDTPSIGPSDPISSETPTPIKEDAGIPASIVDGKLEMRSGPVRLMLFTAAPSANSATPSPTSDDTKSETKTR